MNLFATRRSRGSGLVVPHPSASAQGKASNVALAARRGVIRQQGRWRIWNRSLGLLTIVARVLACGSVVCAEEAGSSPVTARSSTAVRSSVEATPRPAEEPFDGWIPAGYHVESRVHKGLIITGSVTFGTFYLLSLAVAGRSSSAEGHWLAAPLVGPWGALQSHPDPCARHTSQEGFGCLDVAPAAEVIDGIGQLVGALLVTGGLLATREVLVRDSLPTAPRGPNLIIVPRVSLLASGVGLGFGAQGVF
jgi:hypothetical protein